MTEEQAKRLLDKCHMHHWQNSVYGEHKWTWTLDGKIVAESTNQDCVVITRGRKKHTFRGPTAFRWTQYWIGKTFSCEEDTTVEPDEDE